MTWARSGVDFPSDNLNSTVLINARALHSQPCYIKLYMLTSACVTLMSPQHTRVLPARVIPEAEQRLYKPAASASVLIIFDRYKLEGFRSDDCGDYLWPLFSRVLKSTGRLVESREWARIVLVLEFLFLLAGTRFSVNPRTYSVTVLLYAVITLTIQRRQSLGPPRVPW